LREKQAMNIYHNNETKNNNLDKIHWKIID
jgi:hypothetical protein